MMMKRNRKNGRAFFLLAVFTLIVFLLAGCMQPGVDSSGTATPVLAIKNAPEGIDSLTVTVTADDMADLEFTYSTPPASIELEIPAGSNRMFEVVVEVDGLSPAKKYIGSSIADLVAGEASSVTVAMTLSETKILIPDAGNERIVQIDDMQGTNWAVLDGGNLGFGSGDFFPRDIDLDNNARVYVAYTAVGRGESGGLLRIDNISGAGYIPVIAGGCGVYAVAVDDAHNYIYSIVCYESHYFLDRMTLEPLGSGEEFDLVEEGIDDFESYGIDVGPDGKVYICNLSGDYIEVYKFNPEKSSGYRIEAIYGDLSYGCRDVVVKGPYVYVIDAPDNNPASSGVQIVRLNLDLGNPAVYGSYTSSGPPTAPGEYWYPQRFVADLNNKIYLIDEEYYMYYGGDRIISFDNINGNGWQVYGERGDGAGQFKFYLDNIVS